MMDTQVMTLEQALIACMQVMPTSVVAAVARGNVDALVAARGLLAAQGLNEDGRWVGFDQAAAIHNAAIKERLRQQADCKSHDRVSPMPETLG